jgi:hypothetical protein
MVGRSRSVTDDLETNYFVSDGITVFDLRSFFFWVHAAAYLKVTGVLPQGVLLTDWTNSCAVVRATNCDDVSGSRIFYSGKFVTNSITNSGINFNQMPKYIITFNLVERGGGEDMRTATEKMA